MHILLIPSWYPDSKNPVRGIFFKQQAEALAAAGYKVGVLTVYPLSVKDPNYSLKDKLYSFLKPVTHQSGKISLISYTLVYISYKVQIQFLKQWKHKANRLYKNYVKMHGVPDIIHAHSLIYGGIAAASIGKKYNLPVVLTEHSSSFILNKYSKSLLKYAEKSLRNINTLIAVSQPYKKILEKTFEGSFFHVIPNILHSSFLTKCSKISMLKPNNSAFTFITISLFTKNKNHLGLIRAFYRAFSNDERVRLIIGGDGPERQNIEKLIHDLHLEDRVILTGQLKTDEVIDYLKKSHVFVLPSFVETFGIVLIEAMACGLPVIATRSGGPEDIVNKTNGVLIEVGNDDALSNAMKKIKASYKNYNANVIRNNVLDQYGSEIIIDQLTKEYTSLIAEKN